MAGRQSQGGLEGSRGAGEIALDAARACQQHPAIEIGRGSLEFCLQLGDALFQRLATARMTGAAGWRQSLGRLAGEHGNRRREGQRLGIPAPDRGIQRQGAQACQTGDPPGMADGRHRGRVCRCRCPPNPRQDRGGALLPLGAQQQAGRLRHQYIVFDFLALGQQDLPLRVGIGLCRRHGRRRLYCRHGRRRLYRPHGRRPDPHQYAQRGKREQRHRKQKDHHRLRLPLAAGPGRGKKNKLMLAPKCSLKENVIRAINCPYTRCPRGLLFIPSSKYWQI